MNYELSNETDKSKKISTLSALKKLLPLMSDEKSKLLLAFTALIITSILNLTAPYLIGYTIDNFIQTKKYSGVVEFSLIILGIYVAVFAISYMQMRVMGAVGQRTLFKLRNNVFNKLQELPAAFFTQNKTGDLISRINNDTDKLNQFFSQALMQFVGNIFMILGAGVFLIVLNYQLGIATLVPAVLLLLFTQLVSPWVKKKNLTNLQSVGSMSAEIQESLSNFKVIVAFNRRDYFRNKFNKVNTDNYKTAILAGIANNIFTPTYSLASSAAQLIVLMYGIYLISIGNFTIGLLISFLTYVARFYEPLRQIAGLWASFQGALAGWERITQILELKSDLTTQETQQTSNPNLLLEFKNVSFAYPNGKEVLHTINFQLLAGKTYALVGPTGGGKTTTASLMARLFDPTAGEVFLNGKDIRSYTSQERSKQIGFILQEPFLFSGSIKDNLIYGSGEYQDKSNEEIVELINQKKLTKLLERFEQGLDTPVSSQGDTLSLGQRQIIAFMRALLREPKLLILDEATANIDTVTEQLLEEVLGNLADNTTKVIIAHRLNTIENADEIFFINAGEVTMAGSLDHAIEMLMHNERNS